ILTPSDKCRNLGVIFDSDLTFKSHISDVCRSSFYHIRQLRQIRASLDTNSAVLLANALVYSKLDYCNSLFYNLPAKSLNRLQIVQNDLARLVVPSVRRNHHITSTLRLLHWLPIPQRITLLGCLSMEQCSSIDNKLFQTVICNEQHVLHRLLPPKTNNKYSLRPKAHDRQLSAKVSSLYQCNFLQRMLFKDIY